MRKKVGEGKPMANPYDGAVSPNTADAAQSINPVVPVSQGGRKLSMSFTLPSDLVEKMRDVAYFEPGMTLTSIVEQGAKDLIEKMESQRGEPYPSREGRKVPTGRRSG